MKKEIKNLGNSIGIRFTVEECRIYNFSEGDIIKFKITGIKKINSGKKKNEK